MVVVTGKTYPKMNPEVKPSWLTALRSGEYKQGTGHLRRILNDGVTEGYCCLGVLSDLYCKITGNGSWDPKLSQWGCNFNDNGASDGADLLLTVRDWAGLNNDPTRTELARMNDGRMPEGQRYTFNDIADWIEENL